LGGHPEIHSFDKQSLFSKKNCEHTPESTKCKIRKDFLRKQVVEGLGYVPTRLDANPLKMNKKEQRNGAITPEIYIFSSFLIQVITILSQSIQKLSCCFCGRNKSKRQTWPARQVLFSRTKFLVDPNWRP